MASQEPPPPPPPPHGQQPRPPGGGTSSGLPDGNYDIFIIPPHSAGSGFLYLPSLTPHRNSFLAGVACTLFIVGIYTLVVPVVKHWMAVVQNGGGGMGVLFLIIAVAVAAWAFGKTQAEGSGGARPATGGAAGASGTHQRQYAGASPNWQTPPPPPGASQSQWEKAREETRKKEEARRREEDIRKKREEAQKMREEGDRNGKAKAEKEKWEQARAREKEQREREARERIARERLEKQKEQRDKDAKEKADRDKAERIRAAAAASARSSPTKNHVGADAGHSYRPYDKPARAAYVSSASSISGLSEGSYAASQSTAHTTPPPSMRGPYSTNDPDKIQIRAVFLFSDSFPTKPVSQLAANQGHVTDGLILHITTEGLFIDDDIRGVPQREWDVKAWTLKLVEDGAGKTHSGAALHILRATTRDTENKRYTFVLDESEAWKVAVGLQRLKKGSQVRSLAMNGMKDGEVKGLLSTLGFM